MHGLWVFLFNMTGNRGKFPLMGKQGKIPLVKTSWASHRLVVDFRYYKCSIFFSWILINFDTLLDKKMFLRFVIRREWPTGYIKAGSVAGGDQITCSRRQERGCVQSSSLSLSLRLARKSVLFLSESVQNSFFYNNSKEVKC